jgi:hypothetical protein
MVRLRWLAWVTLLLGLAPSGCCKWAEHWCPNCHNTPTAYSAAPACCPVGCVPACPPGCVPSPAASTWQQPVPTCR